MKISNHGGTPRILLASNPAGMTEESILSLRLQNQKKHSPLQLACSKKLPIPKLRFCWVTHNYPIQLSHQRPETLPFPETRWALFAPPVAREGRLCVPPETSGMNVSMKRYEINGCFDKMIIYVYNEYYIYMLYHYICILLNICRAPQVIHPKSTLAWRMIDKVRNLEIRKTYGNIMKHYTILEILFYRFVGCYKRQEKLVILHVRLLERRHPHWAQFEARHPSAIVLRPVVQHEVVRAKLLLSAWCCLARWDMLILNDTNTY